MKYSKFFQILFIVILCVVIYGLSLGNGFIWDDDFYIYKNPWVQRTDGLKTIWFTHKMPQYYPIAFTMFWLEHKLWGLNPFGYHFVNLIFHILNAFLVFCVVQKLYTSLAFPVALLFAIHPIQVETVAWVTEQKNLLGLFFFLLTVLAYLRFDRTRKIKHYLQTIAFFVCALLSKSITACFVCVPVLYKWWRDAKVTWREIRLSIPFVIISFFSVINTIYLEFFHVGAKGQEWRLTFLERLIISGRILVFYIYKLCVPLEFMFIYLRWIPDVTQWWQWLFLLAAIFILGLLFYYRYQIGRGAFTLSLFYIISIFPALSFINVYPMRFSFVADHFSYLSTPSLLLLICVTILFFFNKLKIKFPSIMFTTRRILIWSLCIIIIIYMCGKSIALTQNYKNEIALWEDVIRKNPKAWIAYNNLGVAYNDLGRSKEAIDLCKRAIELKPDFAEAYTNLGIAYQIIGKPEEAIDLYKKAIALNLHSEKVYYYLAFTYNNIGKPEEAIDLYKKAIALNPTFAIAYNNLALLYYYKNEYDLAVKYCDKAVELGYKVESEFLKLLEPFRQNKRQ